LQKPKGLAAYNGFHCPGQMYGVSGRKGCIFLLSSTKLYSMGLVTSLSRYRKQKTSSLRHAVHVACTVSHCNLHMLSDLEPIVPLLREACPLQTYDAFTALGQIDYFIIAIADGKGKDGIASSVNDPLPQ
jgi:hypothetical protein